MDNDNHLTSQDDTLNNTQDVGSVQEEITLDDLTNDEVIDLFIRGMMEEKGSAVGSEQMQSDIFNDLKTRLLKEIDRSLVAELPDEKLEELNAIAMRDGQIDPNLIAGAINEANLNAVEIIGTTMANFRDLYLNPVRDESEQPEIGAE